MSRIVVEGGPHYANFHTTVEIIQHASIISFQRPIAKDFMELTHQLGIRVAKLVVDLMAVKGVIQIFLKPYEVSVHMARAFAWDQKINRLVESAVEDLEHMSLIKGENIVKIKTYPNRFVRSFFTRNVISNSSIERFTRPLQAHSADDLNNVGKTGETIVRQLLKIPGVTEVSIHPYEVWVMIGDAFDWEEIEPAVAYHILKALD